MEKPTTVFPLALLLAAVFVLAAAIAWGVFEAMPHLEDEFAYLFQAKVFASGHLAARIPESPDSFFVPFTVSRADLRFSKYPPGYSLVLALGVLVDQPWLVNALAACLTLLAVYFLGRDLYDRETGMLAASLGAISPMAIILSGTILPHPVTLAELTLFSWCFLRARRAEDPRRVLFATGAGLLLGLAAITRPLTALGLSLPFALLALHDLARHGRRAWIPYAIMLTSLAIPIAWMLWYNQVATGSPFSNTYRLYWDYDTIGFGPQVGQDEWGHSLTRGLLNAWHDLPEFGVVLLGWPELAGVPLASVLLACGLLLRPWSERDVGLLLPSVALVSTYLLYWTSVSGLYGTRYLSEGMPLLWILSARGLQKLTRRPWRTILVKVALALLVAWGVLMATFPRTLDGRQVYGITRAHAGWIESAGLTNALVFVKTRSWPDYAALSWLNRPDLSGEIVFAQDKGPEVNLQVARQFPERSLYLYDGRTHTLTDLLPP